MKPTQDELPALAAWMENQPPQEILRWASEAYGPKLAMATAFGAEGCVLIAMLGEITSDVYLFNLDTGYQFPETLETRDRLIARYGLPIHLVRAEQSVGEMEAANGGPLYRDQPDRCCHIRKVVPLAQALQGHDAWISAIRRDQTPERAAQPIVGWDRKFDLVKINPLANWTKKDVWDYILKNDVPYNPLHDQGFPSIGCWPCTRAVGSGGDDRDGRWAGTAKKECGLHVLNTPVLTR
jgi:phosphoadenosine phosphosulfate reductase